jgi:hypothetical protein
VCSEGPRDAPSTCKAAGPVPARVEPSTLQIANDAIDLLQDAGLNGQKHAINAAVALRQPGQVTIFTSDEDDMRKLCGDRVVS